MRADVAEAVVADRPERLPALGAVARDVCDAGRIDELRFVGGDAFSVEVVLADDEAS
jgi:hypothetical protein